MLSFDRGEYEEEDEGDGDDYNDDDGDSYQNEDIVIAMFPPGKVSIQITIDPSRPMQALVSKNLWVESVVLGGQAYEARLRAGYRITTVQSHSEWIAVETTRELNAALKKVVLRDESVCTLTCSRAHIGESKWNGAVFTDQGVYCIPANARSVLRIDFQNKKVTTFGQLASFDPFLGEVIRYSFLIFAL